MNKYHNRPVIIDGEYIPSRREGGRWMELKLLERAGEITDLRRQVTFYLLPKQKGETRTEKPLKYIADFVYTENGKQVVEDAKGYRTREYIMKRKLMLWIHGIEIREV